MKQFTGRLSSKIWFMLLVLLNVVPISIQAQPIDFSTPRSYYITDDEQGIQQVFQMFLDETQATLQLSHAESDVISFGVSYDTLSMAYISDGQLWVQSLSDTQEAESFVSVGTQQYMQSPIFSPDNRYIAYSNDGVWLLDLVSRETQQLLQDVQLDAQTGNTQAYRIYAPERFIRGIDGSMSHLVVRVSIFEWKTTGIYHLQSGELQLIENLPYTDLLPLYGERMLIYGNNPIDGQPKLYIATNINDIQSYSEVFDFSNLIDDAILFAEQAIEIAPGTVRIVGTTLEGENLETTRGFYFDYNLMANDLVAVNRFDLPVSESSERLIGMMSPEGHYLPILVEIAWDETQQLFGNAEIFDLISGEALFSIPQVSEVKWHP